MPLMPGTLKLPNDQKYALLTLPDRNGSNEIGATVVELGDGYLATSMLPLAVPDHWRTWMGTILYGEVEKSKFHLVVHAPSQTPRASNAENEALQHKVYHFYTGLCVAVPYFSHGEVISLTGGVYAGETEVRNYTRYNRTFFTQGSPHTSITRDRLFAAKRMALQIKSFRDAGDMERFPRILGAFRTAMAAHELDVRLHQFVRCVEGFVLPKNPKADEFAHRVQRVVGGDHFSELRELYTIRGTIEHLKGPFPTIRGSATQKHKTLLKRAIQAETLARYFLRYFLDSPDLRSSFSTESATSKLWSLSDSAFESVWPGRLALAAATRGFAARLPDDFLDSQ